MADWKKKIMKSVGSDLAADEQLEDGIFTNPAGTTAGMVAWQGGLIGAAINSKVQKKKSEGSEISSDTGIAAIWPKAPVVLGLTGRRMLMWSHSTMSGKPKRLVGEIPLDNILSITVEKNKATYAATFSFSDGSAVMREIPKIGNKPEQFIATFTRLGGR